MPSNPNLQAAPAFLIYRLARSKGPRKDHSKVGLPDHCKVRLPDHSKVRLPDHSKVRLPDLSITFRRVLLTSRLPDQSIGRVPRMG
jgi:hypothetical protein